MKQKKAMITWNKPNNQWWLRLETKDGWEFSKAWNVKDQDDNGMAWVHDSIICEIAQLQELGYSVQVIL